MKLTPFQLAGNLTEIVAKHTESSAVWRSSPITEDEMLRVGLGLEVYLHQLLQEWKQGLRHE